MSIRTASAMASGRRTSIIEGFVQTIGINMGGIYVPNFILTAFLLNVMGASNLLIGFASAAQFFAGLLQPLANMLVPRLKKRRLMVSLTSTISRLLFIGAVFLGMYWSGPGAEGTFMVVILLGALLMSFSASGWSTWMADIVPETGRGNYFAIRNSVCALAGVLAVLLGGWLMKILPGTGGFTVIYSIAAASALIGGIFLLFQFEPAPAAPSGRGQLASYKAILKDRNFMAFVKTVILFNLALVIAGPFFTVHFLQYLNVPLDIMAYLTAGATLAGILGNIFFGKLSDILGNRFIMRFTMLATLIPTVMMLFIPKEDNLVFVGAIIVLLAFIASGWGLATFNTSLGISPRNERALYIGVYNSLNSVSAIIAPLVGGLLIDMYKAHPIPVFGMTFPATIPVFVASAVLLLLGLLTFPMYREGSRTEDYSLRDVVLRLDFPEIIYKLFLSTFIPRISRRHRLVEDIVELRSPAAVVPLERLLADMDPGIRLSALEGLGKTGAAEALEVILAFFPRAGALERVEAMKALGAFATDSRVLDILLAETKSPYSTLRIRALVSLTSAAATPRVIEMVKLKLAHEFGIQGLNLENAGLTVAGATLPASASVAPVHLALSTEEYLAYLDLACRAAIPEALAWSMHRYLNLEDSLWKDRFLYAWSQANPLRQDFYRYLSAPDEESRMALREEHLAAVMDLMLYHPRLKEVQPFLKAEAKDHAGDARAYISSVRKAVEKVLIHKSPSTRVVLDTLLGQAFWAGSEEAYLLLSLRSVLESNTD